jgi:membrane associated rhomboid family serine protease
MFEEIRNSFRNGNILQRIIILNVGLFVVQSLIFLLFTIGGGRDTFSQVLSYLYFPESPAMLLRRPWTLFTYQFLHDPFGLFHILFNMLYLWWFGRIAVEFIRERYILPLYLTGGIAGALFFMLMYNLPPGFQGGSPLLVGASASILAIVAAAATIVPDYTVHLILIGPVRLKWIALIAVLLDIVGITAGGNVGGHLAHLGGALTGFLFIRSYQSGWNWFDGWLAVWDNIMARFRNEPRVVYVRKEKKKPSATTVTEDQQQKMDAILDKISRSGYDSLSKEEKTFLFRISNEK